MPNKSNPVSFKSLSAGLMVCALPALISALTALPVKVMVQQNETVEFIPLFKTVAVSASQIVPVVVNAPAHGSVTLVPAKSYFWKQQRPALPAWKSIPVTWFRYVPAPGYTGVDSFTYQVNDGTTSNTETVVLKIHPPEPGGMTVLLLATPSILSARQAEIDRLKADLENEGYAPRIISFAGTTPQSVWDTLSQEFNRNDRFLAGTLLLGRIPTSGTPVFDRGLWNMSMWGMAYYTDSIWSALGDSVFSQYDTTYKAFSLSEVANRSAIHIWVSRFWATTETGGQTSYGTESALMKRMLDANHDYRANLCRYPHKAYLYDLYVSKTFRPSVVYPLWTDVWQDPFDGRTIRPGIDTTFGMFAVYKPGNAGQYWHISSEMNTGTINPSNNGYKYPKIANDTIMRRSFQQRFAVFDGCQYGPPGSGANHHMFTRGGGCVLSVGNYIYRWSCYRTCLADSSRPYAMAFRNLLAAGGRYGRSFILSGIGISSEYFYGDLSLKPNMDTPNAVPVVDSLVRTRPGNGKFRLAAAVRDPDGNSMTYEWWFSRDYNCGRTEPDSVTAVPFVEVDSGRCLVDARLEAVDQWKARSFALLSRTSDQYLDGEGEAAALLPAAGPSLYPNPFAGSLAIRVAGNGPAQVTITDLSGRTVRTLAVQGGAGGVLSLAWDGRDSRGNRTGSGVYLFTVRDGKKVGFARALMMR